MDQWLVVGGDGGLGHGLIKALIQRGSVVAATTRRSESQGIFLDLASKINFEKLPREPKVVFLCAAVTSIAVCEKQKSFAYQVNVEATLALGKWFLERGSFVVFLSSNAVFDCHQEFKPEGASYSHQNEYGRQKATAEQGLLALAGAEAKNLAIVRLSKVVTHTGGVFAGFLKCLRAGERCEAFSDVRISPISLPYAVRSLLKIADARAGGIFHLGSTAELSYVEFARLIAQRLGCPDDRVKAITSVEKGMALHFIPPHPSLTMTEPTLSIGLLPEPIESVLSYLLGEADSTA